jgi:hypothetical protein
MLRVEQNYLPLIDDTNSKRYTVPLPRATTPLYVFMLYFAHGESNQSILLPIQRTFSSPITDATEFEMFLFMAIIIYDIA